MDYRYEVREGDAILATGLLSVGSDLQPGDEIPFGEHVAVVTEVAFSLSGRARLVLERREPFEPSAQARGIQRT
jgi:hypothetical protein